MRAWWRWRRDLKRLRLEAADAYNRWMRARYAHQDAVVVFAGQPGAWSDAGPIGKAANEEVDRMNEYTALRDEVRRMEEVGPR